MADQIGADVDLLADMLRLITARGTDVIGYTWVQRNVRVGFAKAGRLIALAQNLGLVGLIPQGGRYPVLYAPADTDRVIAAVHSRAAAELAGTGDPASVLENERSRDTDPGGS